MYWKDTHKCSTDIVTDLFKTERVIIQTGLVGACGNAALHTKFLPSECEWFFIVSLFFIHCLIFNSHALHTHSTRTFNHDYFINKT